MSERVAIVGIGITEHKSKWLERSQVEIVNEAVRLALEDVEIRIKDVDCVVTGNMELFEGNYHVDMWMTEGDGAFLKSGMRINTGGTVGASTLYTAVEHAGSGLFNAVLAVGWQKQDEGSSAYSLRVVHENPFLTVVAPSRAGVGIVFNKWAQDLLARKSVTEEQVALLRVQASENASKNPKAHLRDVLTVEEVMHSPFLVAPTVRLLHICPTSIGAVAVILAPESTARKLSKKPIWVVDHVTSHCAVDSMYITAPAGGGMLGPTFWWPSQDSIKKLYKRNGITDPRKELDVFEFYDPSVWVLAEGLEIMGLCEKNQVGKLIESGRTRLDGETPVNPSGGVLCTNAIGDSAMMRPAQLALQLRGDAGAYQVSKRVSRGLAHGLGGDFAGACILQNHL
ncbi:MAG: acetyl-CoA acetyltransferase [Deltaproteobacteria bacterium]|nr:acetyl-CoA acetyltransferase [Deltaproteobacteria bacterium]